MMAAPLLGDQMTISELADLSGVPVKTIRYDEDEELLRDVERSPAGYRLFDPRHLRRLRLIRAMRSLGLPLAEVRVLVEVAFDEDCGRFETRLAEQVERRHSDVDRAIEELTELRSTLDGPAQRLDRAASPCQDADTNRPSSTETAGTPLRRLDLEHAAIGAAVGAGCRPCLTHHLDVAREQSMHDDRIRGMLATAEQALSVARGGFARHAAEILGDDLPDEHPDGPLSVLVTLGVAVGDNAVELARAHLDRLAALGITERDRKRAVNLARAVQRTAGEMTVQPRRRRPRRAAGRRGSRGRVLRSILAR